MKKIAIVGTGGLGREVLGIIESINKESLTWDFIGFYDDNLSEGLINGYSVIGKIDDLNFLKEELFVVIGIGNPSIKEIIRNKITNCKVKFPNLVHPTAVIYSMENVIMGMGIVIAANCVLTVNINLSDFVYINTSSVIAHDTKIGSYSMIMPTTSISTGAIIGDRVYIGNGTKIDYPIKIENDSRVKAGSVFTDE